MSNENYVAIIGPPRSGTTWLYRYLREHPGVFVPFIKEFNWYTIQMGQANPNQVATIRTQYEQIRDRRAAKGLDLGEQGTQRKERFEMASEADFKAFFQSRVDDTMPYFDISPSYSTLTRDGFAQMAQTFANAKIVMLLRNKAERAWSVAHHVKRLNFPDKDIGFVNSYLNDLAAKSHVKTLRGVYANVTSIFAPQRVLCLFTEDLFAPDTQQSVLDQLAAFVGVAPHPVGDFSFDGNRGHYDEIPPLYRREATRMGAEDFEWAAQHMGRLPVNWQADKAAYLDP